MMEGASDTKIPRRRVPAFAILDRNQGACHDRYEHFAWRARARGQERAADLAAAVKLLAIGANRCSGSYCRN
jgi:hypothetical protein